MRVASIKFSEERISAAYAQIESAAIHGARCPMSSSINTSIFTTLARRGRIRVEVFRLNWRTVEILEGPHAGKRTAEVPHEVGARTTPYVVVEKSGTYRNGKLISAAGVIGEAGGDEHPPQECRTPSMLFVDGKRVRSA